ncbi:hypothetical protein L1O03_00345 [Corynebacterium uropygiale]|uniref:Secreted protein n=1 Tax=Corynebacterium uropygiale TaxID=1775911 RepID=A0A9X1QLU5_9CORY|nr:hypothetical protein [Corynebacterium uropygiale]MCF4005637.1 hypothetical protein [Corynebacterium uropygiale]
MKKLIALSAAVVLWGAAGVAAALPEESGKREEAAVAETFYDPEAPPELAEKTPISESQGSKDRQILEKERAAQFAEAQVGKGYELNFAISRSAGRDSKKFNCSSLVWASYMAATEGSIDLGKNRWISFWRYGVYPIDLANSADAKEVQ